MSQNREETYDLSVPFGEDPHSFPQRCVDLGGDGKHLQ